MYTNFALEESRKFLVCNNRDKVHLKNWNAYKAYYTTSLDELDADIETHRNGMIHSWID